MKRYTIKITDDEFTKLLRILQRDLYCTGDDVHSLSDVYSVKATVEIMEIILAGKANGYQQ